MSHAVPLAVKRSRLRPWMTMVVLLALFLAALPSSWLPRADAASAAGPVIVDGTDSGLHGSVVLDAEVTPDASELRSTWIYMLKAWETLLDGVPSSYSNNDRVAVIGATESDATTNDCGAAAGYIAERLAGGPVGVDYVEGATAIADLLDDVLAGTQRYAMIQIVEQGWCGNGLSAEEAAEVNARGAAIAAHVNRGGALFAQSQSYGWLNSLFPSISASTGCSGSTPELTAAGFAQFPGLSNADVAAPWHNCFVLADGEEWPLTPLALQDDTDVVILGGSEVSLPSNVALAFDPQQPRPGEEACATATVTDSGTTVEGASVEFTRTGDSGTETSTQTTAADGTAAYCYTAGDAGADEVTATVSTGSGQGSASAELVWSAAALTADTGTTNAKGDEVCIDATIATVDDPAADPLTLTPSSDAEVAFTVVGANDPDGSTLTTDDAGVASYCYTGVNGGTDVLTATLADGDARSVELTWSGPQLSIPDISATEGVTGKVVPVTVEGFDSSTTLEAVITAAPDAGTFSLDATALELTDESEGTLGFIDQTGLAFSGSVADITAALGSKLTWATPADAGAYQLDVTVTDTRSTAINAEASSELIVLGAPLIVTQPTATSVTAGSTATFVVTAAADDTVTYQWQVSTDEGATWSAVEGASSASLEVATTSDLDGNHFRVVLNNPQGTVTSDAVELTVTTPVSARPAPEPEPVPDEEGELQRPAPGAGEVVIGDGTEGDETSPTVTSTSSRATVSGDGFQIDVWAADGDGAESATGVGDVLRVPQGGRAGVGVEGFEPRSTVRVWLFSEPTLIGEFTTDAEGALEVGLAEVVADLSPCAHTLQAEGRLADGRSAAAAIGVWVTANPFPFGDVDADGYHAPGIGCLEANDIAHGYSTDHYDEAGSITRAQTASMVGRALGLDGAEGTTFSDTAGSGHGPMIEALAAAGIIQGVSADRFDPSGTLERGQVATVLARAAGLTSAGEPSFTDTTESVHAPGIAALVEAGVIEGFGDGTFRPAEPVTRGQFASLLSRTLPLLATNDAS